ncbi:Xaa-Pro peptidase family protein [Thalassobaculum sp. OXR-137]|uniref:M24 family metallopeptidase n=1 Tax=Thalassobaculum sp. OXR-137 TaxID=3100173 RepID=UPI002AC9F096|nr:Xaa-Pro peptidase family protein [Thalassobaculum sp. OXR-137]WPZ32931.1 Xaa-Pro peptidase family protein [Thalassobaculum sp. OXR-137]
MADDRPPRGFPAAEFESRLARAQALMDAQGLDALLLTTEPDIRWFTGFLTQFWLSPTRPWFLVVPATGKPVAVIPGIGSEAMGRTWIEDIRTWSSPHPGDDGLTLLADALREAAGEGGAVGLQMGPETHLRMPLRDLERLRAALPGLSWEDASGVMRRLRQVKSKAEIAKIAEACRIACDAFDRLPEIAGAGMTEVEVFRAFKIACLQAGADDVDYLVGGAGPGGYGDIISPPSERRLQAGDVLILDVGLVFDGYYCDFDRNFSVGPPSDPVKRAYEAVWLATEAGLAAARAGVTCADLFRAMNAVTAPLADPSAGGAVGRLGHGLGMVLTEFPSIADWDDTVLEPGYVMTLEPGMATAPGKMMVHEENVAITQEAPRLLTRRADREIPVLSTS